MVNVKGKKCLSEGCNTAPYFNYQNETNGIYCAEHALEGMINIKSAYCQIKGCTKQATFGNEKGKPIRCADHKEDMKNVLNVGMTISVGQNN